MFAYCRPVNRCSVAGCRVRAGREGRGRISAREPSRLYRDATFPSFSGTRVVIREIKRGEGGMVTISFQLRNETDMPRRALDFFETSVLNHVVHLIDLANKKKYRVVEDSSGACLCSPFQGEVSKDRPLNLWAKLPAPPESVEKVMVVVRGFEPIESVPITAR
jgi:hypothetical protein